MASDATGRANQRRRTRKDLLEATTRLVRQGHQPSLEEIAAEAMVSRATAYRYFPKLDALLLEAALDVAIPLGSDRDHWTLRATLGPIIMLDPGHRSVVPVWPNLEFSRPLGEHGELTLLGNGLVGWRGIF